MHRAVHLIEWKLLPRAVVLVPVHVVNRLIKAAAKGHVQLLEAAADRKQRSLVLDSRSDERKGQRIAKRIERLRLDWRLIAIVLRRDIRDAAGQEYGIGHIEDGSDVGYAGTDRYEQRLAVRHLGDDSRIFSPHGVEDIAFDQRGAGRDDDNRTAHAASSPATSLRVRSSARAITASASSNCSCVQINGGAVTMVSNTARMMKPSRKKWSRQIRPTRPGSAKRPRFRLSATSSMAPRRPI